MLLNMCIFLISDGKTKRQKDFCSEEIRTAIVCEKTGLNVAYVEK